MEPEIPEESRPALVEVPRPLDAQPLRYDFRRAERLAPEQLRPVEAAFAAFVAGAQASLSAYLHTPCAAAAAGTRQPTYGELAAEFPAGTAAVSLALDPHPGRAVLALSPAALFAVLELLLGARGGAAAEIERELTEIERNLLDSVLQILLQELREAWGPAGAPSFEAQNVNAGVLGPEALAAGEPVVALSAELTVGDQAGRLQLALPSTTVRIMGERRGPQRLAPSPGSSPARDRLARLVAPARVWLEARLEGSHIRLQDLAGLRPGQVVDLGHPVGYPLDCAVNGKPKYRAQPVALEGKFGVQVEGRWEPE